MFVIHNRNKMKFLNRTEELKRITNSLLKGNSLVILYGRRRIGKSAILQQVIKESDIYYLSDLQDASLQKNELAQEIGLKIDEFDSVNYPDWKSIFTQLNKRNFKGTLCIDEFPYLVKQTAGLPSIFQKLLDKKEISFNLLLCGSSQQMMKGLFLDSTTPLYGRANEILKISAMDISWLKEALNLSAEKAVKEYSVWGGIPRYWELRSDFNNFDEAVRNLVLDPLGILHEEPIRLFMDEMRTAIQPMGILTTIANGSNRLSEIAGRLGKPVTQISRPLQQLIELNFIRRETPFGENDKIARKSLYKIDDPFLSFYFRFISPNRSLLSMRLINRVEQLIKKNFPIYVSQFYEHLCRSSLFKMNINGLEIGEAKRWWGTNSEREMMEIDIVAETSDKKFLITGEVKWSDKVNEKAELNKLMIKSRLLPFANGREIIPCLFVKKKTKNSYAGSFVFDSDDVV